MSSRKAAGRYDVIEVCMRGDDSGDAQTLRRDVPGQQVRIVTGVDDDRFAGLRVANDVAIARERSHLSVDKDLEAHRRARLTGTLWSAIHQPSAPKAAAAMTARTAAGKGSAAATR